MMKKILLTAVCLAAMASVYGQNTPRAVMESVPALPTPAQWAVNNGHTEDFAQKIVDLNERLNQQQMAAVSIPTVTQADIEQEIAAQQRRVAESNAMMEQMFGVGIADLGNMSEAELQAKIMGGAMSKQAEMMAQIEKQMAVMASLGITEADMRRLENMNDAQSEAYIQRRLRENGHTQADLERKLREAGITPLSEGEAREEERRQREAEEQAAASERATTALENYMKHVRITEHRLDSAALAAEQKLAPLREKYETEIGRLHAQMGEQTGLYIPQPGDLPLETLERQVSAAIREYREQSYDLWTQYVRAAQGILRDQLPYAEAADEAQKTLASVVAKNSSSPFAQMQGMSNHAVEVAMQYLHLTASEPEVGYEYHEPRARGGDGNEKG